MEFPTVIDVTSTYDPNLTMIIKKGYFYASPSESRFEVETADEISRTFWRLDELRETNGRYSNTEDKIKEYLIENYEELGDHADEIAKLMGIELSKTVEVIFDVTIRATISIPVGKDASDLSVYDFDIEISSNESEYEIEESEADIDQIREN